MRNYEMKKTGNRIKTVRCLLTFMWFRQIISAGNVRRQILKLLSGAPAADEVNDQAFGNGLLPGVLLPVKENHFLCYFFRYGFAERPLQDLVVFQKNFSERLFEQRLINRKRKVVCCINRKSRILGVSNFVYRSGSLWCIRFSGLQKCFCAKHVRKELFDLLQE